jgi:hypothetical protein
MRSMVMETDLEDWHFLSDATGARVRHNLGLPGTLMYGRDAQLRVKMLLTKRLPRTRDEYCRALQRSVRCMLARRKMAVAKRAKLALVQRAHAVPAVLSGLEVDRLWEDYCDACTTHMTHPVREIKAQIAGGRVTLEGYTLSHNGVMALSRLVQGMATLGGVHTLCLTDNNIRGHGVRALADALTSASASLQALYLDKNAITSESHDVRSLNAAEARLGRGDTGCNALVEIMRHTTTLTLLSLSHNSLGNDGLVKLAREIPEHPSLTSLRLEYNNATPPVEMLEAAHTLGETLTRSTKLIEFFYGGNSLLGRDALALLGGVDPQPLHGLLQSQSLRRLHLQDNGLFKQLACVEAFAACISSANCVLHYVDLSNNMLSKEV